MAGGYLDQPATLMMDLEAVRKARDEAQAVQRAKPVADNSIYKDLAARAQALAAKGG